MLDNLRDDASSRPFFEDEEPSLPPEPERDPVPLRLPAGRFLGMTPVQRFIISVLLMMTVCLLGTMFLLATEKIGLYF